MKTNIMKIVASISLLAPGVVAFGNKAEAASDKQGTVTASALNIRQSPNTKAKVLGTLYKGNTVSYTDYNSSWVKLTYKGKIAYVSKLYIKGSTTTAVNPPVQSNAFKGTVTASVLNVRTSASTTAKIVGTLKKGTVVEITKSANGWYYVTAGNVKGWCSAQYITKTVTTVPVEPPAQSNASKGTVTASVLNVRTSASTTAKIVGTLKKGTVVEITKSANGWYYVTAGSIKGWSSAQYITKTQDPAPTPTPDVKPVATDYKTMDIRYPSKVTAQEINDYISKYETYTGKKSVFSGQGQLFITIGTETGINQLILAAMAIHESAYGTNYLSNWKNNLFSVGAYDSSPYDSAYMFTSVEQAVRYQAYFLKSGYLNPSSWKFKGYYLGDAAGGLNYYYASDKQWGEKIANHANKIHPFNATEYTNISIMDKTASAIALPETVDMFSSETKATANAVLSVKGTIDGSEVTTIPQGAEFTVLAKYNNQWFKVEYNGTIGYFKVNLSTYKTYFQIKNLIRTADYKYYTQVLENDVPVLANGQTQVYVNGQVQSISTSGTEQVYR
ncbi:SH3 domain-containing protein [Bacillus sp. 165]|uniref:SH3 domain-containing protein n=1 Tax=Bacillus sp. 165 TaxID=1529117 RepID=UPI001ADC77F8|nr:SH3 domain-containing protein [Bacillus sp. 165]MBO9129107.1 SH3 domain-containing protein [Bacillus sp. 165]